MKTLILYGTKYGSAKVVAEKISKIGDTICDIKDFNGSLNEYDQIIIGSSIYVGMMDKMIKEFIKNHYDELQNSTSLLYLCGLSKENKDKVVEDNIKDRKVCFGQICFVGGTLDFDRMSFFERLIIKLINKKANFVQTCKGKHNLLIEGSIQKIIEWKNR